MQRPSWLWNPLLRRYWPANFLHDGVAQGLAWAVENSPHQPRSEEAPIFVLSAGWRSGSTLLQRLLNSHPEVLVWGEAYEQSLMLHHLSAPLAGFTKIPLNLDFLPEKAALAPSEMASMLTTDWIANLTPPLADLKRAHWAYLEALFKTQAVTAGRPRWGIKMVRGTVTVARYLRWLYPQAKLLYLFRDPYAAFLSYTIHTKRGWYLYYPSHRVKGVISFAVHWKHCMDGFLDSVVMR